MLLFSSLWMNDACMCLVLSRLSGETNLTAHVQASSVGGKKHSVSTDYVLKVLGLDVCSDAVVGNDMLRGISGGQRKRVTTGLSLSLSGGQRKRVYQVILVAYIQNFNIRTIINDRVMFLKYTLVLLSHTHTHTHTHYIYIN